MLTNGGLASLKTASGRSKSQSSRAGQKTTRHGKLAREGVQRELNQDGSERPTRQTPPSVSAGQSVPVGGKWPSADQYESGPAHVGETAGQNAPEVGKGPAVDQYVSKSTHSGESTGPLAPVVGERPTVGSEKSNSVLEGGNRT